MPETGVCSSNLIDTVTTDRAPGGCCGAVDISAPAGQGLATGIAGGLLTVIDSKPATASGYCN
ncbi:hypothetical protein [Kribbella endophytica]